MRRVMLRGVLLWLVAVVIASAKEQCPATSNTCTCEFSEDSEDGGASAATAATSKSEMLAAAAGAMSPLLIGGAGLGIYKLVKGRGEGSFDLKRSDSTLSNTSSPPKYSSRRESIGPDHHKRVSPKPAIGRDPNAWMESF